jgi:cytochrome b561
MFRNTNIYFGSVAKVLHWSIAIAILVEYCSVHYRRQFTVEEELYADWVGTGNYRAFQIHAAVGITIFVFAVLRLIWRWSNPQPSMPAGKPWEHFMARSAHYCLYILLFAMPITGYMGTFADTEYLGIPQFSNTALYDWFVTGKLGIDWATFEAPLDYVHRSIGGALLLWILIATHAGAALYHHYVKRDEVLVRMLPERWSLRKEGKTNERE